MCVLSGHTTAHSVELIGNQKFSFGYCVEPDVIREPNATRIMNISIYIVLNGKR